MTIWYDSSDNYLTHVYTSRSIYATQMSTSIADESQSSGWKLPVIFSPGSIYDTQMSIDMSQVNVPLFPSFNLFFIRNRNKDLHLIMTC